MSSPVRFPQDHHYDFDLWIWHLLTMFEKAKAYPLKLRRVLPKISRMFDSWVVIDRERLDFLDFFGLEEVTDLSWRLSSSEVSEVKSMTSMSSVLTAKPDLFISLYFRQIFLGENKAKNQRFFSQFRADHQQISARRLTATFAQPVYTTSTVLAKKLSTPSRTTKRVCAWFLKSPRPNSRR